MSRRRQQKEDRKRKGTASKQWRQSNTERNDKSQAQA